MDFLSTCLEFKTQANGLGFRCQLCLASKPYVIWNIMATNGNVKLLHPLYKNSQLDLHPKQSQGKLDKAE